MEMTREIAQFMQNEDKNGFWMDAVTELKTHDDIVTFEMEILDTLYDWLEDGLTPNNRIQGYINHLGRHMHESVKEIIYKDYN